MSDAGKISGPAALAVGAAERQLERLKAIMEVARVYAGVGRFDSAQHTYRQATKETITLVRHLKKVLHLLRTNEFLPQDAPAPRPHPDTPFKPGPSSDPTPFKVIK